MKEDKSLKNKDLEKIFEKMNLILLDRSPLVARMIDFERIKKGANELPSAFMERMFSNLSSSQMDMAPPVARARADHLIKVMRENPTIDKKKRK